MKLRVYRIEERKKYFYNGPRFPRPQMVTGASSKNTNGSYYTNIAGGEAFPMNPEMALYAAVVTSSLAPMFYEGVDERIERISQLVIQCDHMFVAQLAVYARTQMYMRSVPLLLAVELAKIHSGDNLVSRMVSQIVLRADEIMELLSCYHWRNPYTSNGKRRAGMGSLSRQIQSGLQKAFNRFDEYQFAKYNNDKRAIKLRDALFLVHPKAESQKQQEIFNNIASESLATPYTWETELSALGQKKYTSQEEKDKAFAQKWGELILSGRLGYMAMLRNLRNILSLKDMTPQAMDTLTATISDKKAILSSKQLPFRFLSAYREIRTVTSIWTSAVMQALEEAVRHSAQNIEGFSPKTRVVIASDVSGSMMQPISPQSSVELYDIGLMLSMLLRSRCRQVITGIFGSTWKEINLPADNILANVMELRRREGEVGYSTNGYLVIEDLISRKVAADKVMIFTDMQMWNSDPYSSQTFNQCWSRYKAKVAPYAQLYLFDLAGYGDSPISLLEKDVYLISGWSDKIFDTLYAIENGSSAIEEIKKIPL